ncbi:MAG TPA: hypothetical protein VMR54_04515 [Thermoanaerobaculia bacterium]|nr:hypothetical protein [Thermoanaerobaculia bacterium]
MTKAIGLGVIAGLLATLARAQSASPDQPAPTPPPSAAAPTPAAAPGPAVVLPVPAPVLRLADPPVITVETLPSENPFATPADTPAMPPVKPATADAVIPATFFASVRVDPKGKAVSLRRMRDPIPSLSTTTQTSLLRWVFDPGRKAGQAVETWASLRLDLAVEIDSPKIEQFLLTPITPSTPLAKPLEWGNDADWLAGVKPGPPLEGTVANEQLDTPPVPKKQPWSSSSYKGPFSAKFWVRINQNGRVEKTIPIQASDPVLIAYFRKQMESWAFRPARTGASAVATWNELTLGGQISFDSELKSTASLRQSL